MTDKKPRKLSPDEQSDLDRRLIDAAIDGHTKTVQTLLANGADVHARNNLALYWAAMCGHTETVEALLANGADVHAQEDAALRWAAYHGHTETVKALARHIFGPNAWRGKSRAEIEAQADALYGKIKTHTPSDPIKPEPLRMAGDILIDYALRCWHQVRPAPPKIQISPLPAQPRPV
jgi:hypothetical protein